MSPPPKRWTCLLFFNFENRIQTVRASRMENDLANTVTQNHDIQLTVIVPSSLSLELGGGGEEGDLRDSAEVRLSHHLPQKP